MSDQSFKYNDSVVAIFDLKRKLGILCYSPGQKCSGFNARKQKLQPTKS